MANRNIVPSLEAKSTDGNSAYTPRQWLERLRQFWKQEHKNDIVQLLKGESNVDTDWNGKEQAVREIFFGEWERKHFIK